MKYKNMEKLQKIDVYNILYIMQQRVKKDGSLLNNNQ